MLATKISKVALIVLSTVCTLQSVYSQQVSQVDLTNNGKWEFRQADNDTWYTANVPSTVHLDLLDNNLVLDPYYRDNQMLFYKYELLDWEYRTSFSVDADTLSKQVVELVFEGLDTHANVTLNGQLIASTNNMHRTWIVDVKDILKASDLNNLTVYFKSSCQHDIEAAEDMLPYVLPVNYSYSRKAQY